MNKPVTIEGRWVIRPNIEPLFGTLTFDPDDGIRLLLKLAKQFTLSDVLLPAKSQEPPNNVVIGHDDNDKPVTLFGCANPGRRMGAGLRSLRFHPLCALIGRGVADWQEACFDNAEITLTLLNEWVSRPQIQLEGNQVVWPDIPATEITLPAGTVLRIEPTVHWEHSQARFTADADECLKFKFTEPKHIAAILRADLHPFRRFLTFCVGSRVFFKSIEFVVRSGESWDKLRFLQSYQGASRAPETLSSQVRIHFSEVKDHLIELIQRWYGMESSLGDALDLYFAVEFNDSLYDTQRFLFLAQALEVYHRASASYQQEAEPTEVFEERKKRILDSVSSPPDRRWLGDRIRYGNEKSFVQRLADLVQRHAAQIAGFIRDPIVWVQTVKKARNHYTHYATKASGRLRLPRGIDLMRLTCEMEALLDVCFLADLGVSGKPVARAAEKLRGFRYLSLSRQKPHPPAAATKFLQTVSDLHGLPQCHITDSHAASRLLALLWNGAPSEEERRATITVQKQEAWSLFNIVLVASNHSEETFKEAIPERADPSDSDSKAWFEGAIKDYTARYLNENVFPIK